MMSLALFWSLLESVGEEGDGAAADGGKVEEVNSAIAKERTAAALIR